ncbi:MAG: TraB/GumN family protein [Lachnospiraceae bacterium]|nr:TraB/GumN family protein [Lachnospiraceae bacterium]
MQKDNLEAAISAISGDFPIISEILIHERDQYLAHKIKNAPGKKIVTVLGAAHVAGVKKEIFCQQNIQDISSIPPQSIFTKVLAWIIPAVIVFLLVYGFMQNFQTGIQQLASWVFWNGFAAALFTAVLFGHPLSVLTALISAPITSLNPFIACGWFAGLVEAAIRKPTVRDINNVSNDIFHFKSFCKNRFLKALAIVIFANVGSTIGTIIGGSRQAICVSAFFNCEPGERAKGASFIMGDGLLGN